MSDPRSNLVKSIEQSVISVLEQETLKQVVDKVIIALNDYEITDRCTDIVPIDDTNTKLVKKYCACLMINGKSEGTAYQYRRTVNKLAESLNKPFTEMTVYDLRFFLANEKRRGVSDRSLENTRSHLSAFYTWLSNEEFIQRNPMAMITPIKYPKEIRKEFSDVEIDKLRYACRNERERALIEMLLASGVRVAELSEMEVGDIDFQNLQVHVVHGKGAKERSTYLTPLAAERLKAYFDSRPSFESQYVFYNFKHDKLMTGGVRSILNSIAKRAQVEDVHPHRFRRTFATNLAKRGMDIRLIKELLGHSNIGTTLEYVRTSNEEVMASYRKFAA